jgi:hypothetical protein
MTAAEHGTISAYRGSATREPCRCATCKRGWAEYMRNRRTKSVPERSKTRVVKPTNVVQMPSPQVAARAAAQPGMGANEAGVLERFEQLDTNDPALKAQCVTLARLIDDGENVALIVPATKQLHLMLTGAAQGKKKKSRGKLASVQALSAVRRKAAQ